MEVPFIFMTIAWVIMLIVVLILQKKNKKLNDQYQDILNKKYSEYMGFGKTYRTLRRFIVIDNAGDNGTLNRTVDMYLNDGYYYDTTKSTDRLLVFRKDEEIKDE